MERPHIASFESKAPIQVSISRLRKTYGGIVALEGADLEVRRGEFVTLLGPSGSGKTTLLMLIAGLLLPDSGRICIGGRDVTYLDANKRDIGMVFQNYALFPHLTVAENLAFPLEMRKVPKPEIARKVQFALETVRLPQAAHRLPSELSGGQQQRIALARSMVYEPDVILMDEPLGALDKKLREHMQLEIMRIHKTLGVTIIYVTHDQEEALTMSDRICLMNNATIEQDSAPASLYFRPATVFAANFLGESNLLTGEIESCADSRITVRCDGGLLVAVGNDPRQPVVSPGRQVRIMVRPERIRILRPGETAANMVPVTVGEIILAGQVTKYFGQTAQGVRLTAAELTQSECSAHQTGATVTFGWEVDAAVVILDDEGTGRSC